MIYGGRTQIFADIRAPGKHIPSPLIYSPLLTYLILNKECHCIAKTPFIILAVVRMWWVTETMLPSAYGSVIFPLVHLGLGARSTDA